MIDLAVCCKGSNVIDINNLGIQKFNNIINKRFKLLPVYHASAFSRSNLVKNWIGNSRRKCAYELIKARYPNNGKINYNLNFPVA